MSKRGPYKNNLFHLSDRNKTIELPLYCSICKKEFLELVKWNVKLEKLRCPKCVNPVELVYPKEPE
jgi:DNA-directed RNA polymerase subunit RPC12/RpoP